jgi:hypothetical protein
MPRKTSVEGFVSCHVLYLARDWMIPRDSYADGRLPQKNGGMASLMHEICLSFISGLFLIVKQVLGRTNRLLAFVTTRTAW